MNVGDSRGYLIRDNYIFQITRDHSLVQEKLTLGIYDRDGAKKDPQKNILTRTVGFDLDVNVDTYDYEYQEGDLFLFCSDGLHGKVCDKNILEIINLNFKNPDNSAQESLDKSIAQLIHQANTNGGQDNISVILTLIP
jgi:protein phosphatase